MRRLPSGDQTKPPTPFLRFVTRRASPPSSGRSQTCVRGCDSGAPVVVCKALGTPGVVAVTFAAGVVEVEGVACGAAPGVTAAFGVGVGVGVGVTCDGEVPRCVESAASDQGRAERKAMARPSGDRRGELADC